MLTGHFGATRFAQKPLPQPTYNFANVPQAERDLRGSALQRVDDREAFQTSMAEMLLLCKEAMRRRPSKSKSSGSKPLSLEYLADRFDIDDPIFGFLVRTNENQTNSPGWQKGMLQGFITVTTFTNYQKSFRWDSQNETAFSFDTEQLAQERANGIRKWDEDGSLAWQMENTVRMGDIWNEGIVWPRIAEISLLGGLGCGKTLVSLVVEQLECMKASGKCNYDYVVLQATDNSISFYESMGFVRVGAVIKDEKAGGGESSSSDSSSSSSSDDDDDDDDEIVAEPVDESSPEKPNALARPYHIISSELTTYTTKKAGETPKDIAKKFRVDVWDIVFLNNDIYNEICPSSRLLEGTILHIPVTKDQKPAPEDRRMTRNAKAETPQWYTAKENETPRTIARKFEVNCLDLVEANKSRLPGLLSNSRLKEGTRLKVSHLDVHEFAWKPYPHWSFPDDSFEEGEPSYMMARKLNRRRGIASRHRPFEASLAASISDYEPTELLLPASPGPIVPAAAAVAHPQTTTTSKKKRKRHPDEPVPPKRPLCAFLLYAQEQRELQRSDLEGLAISQSSKMFGDEWRDLSDEDKAEYEKTANVLREQYFEAKAEYEEKLAAFQAANPGFDDEAPAPVPTAASGSSDHHSHHHRHRHHHHHHHHHQSLYNKVVRLKPGAMTEGSEYTYWYVLTFIPDLKWCHLAPMIQVGEFGPDKKKSAGRPKWKLVDESLGKEVDISSSFCIPIKSRSMKKTLDADREEWDIIDDGSDPGDSKPMAPRSLGSDFSSEKRAARKSTAMKPSAERKQRSRPSSELPRLLAVSPGSKHVFYVKLEGTGLHDPSFDYPVKKKIGRPKGSKNKPKDPQSVIKKIRRLPGSKNTPKITGQDATAKEVPLKRGRGRSKGSSNKVRFPTSIKSLRSKSQTANKEDLDLATSDLSPASSRGRLRRSASLPPSLTEQSRPRRKAAPSSNMSESPASPRLQGSGRGRKRKAPPIAEETTINDESQRASKRSRKAAVSSSLLSEFPTGNVKERPSQNTASYKPAFFTNDFPDSVSVVYDEYVGKGCFKNKSLVVFMERHPEWRRNVPGKYYPRLRVVRDIVELIHQRVEDGENLDAVMNQLDEERQQQGAGLWQFLHEKTGCKGNSPVTTGKRHAAEKQVISESRKRSKPETEPTTDSSQRKAAPVFGNGSMARKRRKVNNAGSRRSVLQS